MRLRKILRIAGLVLLILLACSGMGLPIIMRQKENFGSEVKIELVEDRREDELISDESEEEVK